MRLCLAAALLSLGAGSAIGPAAAYQSAGAPLEEVLALAKPYPNLVLQVRLQLVRANLKRDQVTCTSERLPPDWVKLQGARLAPYRCAIGRRTLVVTAVPTYLDVNGRKVKAGDPELPRKAAKVTETKLKWSWK